MDIAQENSGKLVALVWQNAKLIAGRESLGCIITDGPPCIGCPVISSLSGASLALLVTEPTLSGASLALLVTEPTLSGIHDHGHVIGVVATSAILF